MHWEKTKFKENGTKRSIEFNEYNAMIALISLLFDDRENEQNYFEKDLK